jgi:hypothetical protein
MGRYDACRTFASGKIYHYQPRVHNSKDLSAGRIRETVQVFSPERGPELGLSVAGKLKCFETAALSHRVPPIFYFCAILD